MCPVFDRETIGQLSERERFRNEYGRLCDPIHEERLLWRAQSLRHLSHILPGETILELGSSGGAFARQIAAVTRGENPITCVTFAASSAAPETEFEILGGDDFPAMLDGRQFDLITGLDLLDERNCSIVLQAAYRLLRPGGQLILYESNPWNVVLRMRRTFGRLFGYSDSRRLLNRRRLYELISEIGFIRVITLYNDFVYAPLNRPVIWVLRNLSIMFENTPWLQTLAGSILIYGQKPGFAAHERIPASLASSPGLKRAISVVIPCHNEEMNINPMVARLTELYGEYLHEIILVDDNSTDNTAFVIRTASGQSPLVKGVFRKPPNGVGRALRDGYREASGKYVLSMDCDFLQLLPELRDLFDAAAEHDYDVVIGSRFSRHSVLLNYPVQKIIANRAFHLLARMAFHRRFRDLTNNLKLMKREVVNSLLLEEPHFAVNAETGLQPLLMGYSIGEVPISWINRAPDMGVSSFRLVKAGGGYGRVLLRLARRTRLGFRRLRRGSPSLASVEASDTAPSSL